MIAVGFSYEEFIGLLSDEVRGYIEEYNDNTMLFKSPEEEYYFLEVREDWDGIDDSFLAGFGWMDKDTMLDLCTRYVEGYEDMDIKEINKTIKENPLRVIGDLVSWYGLDEFTVGYSNPWQQLLPDELDAFAKKYMRFE